MAARFNFVLLLVASGVLTSGAIGAPAVDRADVARRSDAVRVDPALRKALAETRSLLSANNNDAQQQRFERAIQQKVAPLVQSVPVTVGAPKQYTRLVLNGAGATLDAFRFKVPARGSAWNLRWEFLEASPGNVTQWYIVPREGTMSGFSRYDLERNYQEAGAKLPAKNRRFKQTLEHGELKAGGEYLIWFAFSDGRPADIHVRLGVTPATSKKMSLPRR